MGKLVASHGKATVHGIGAWQGPFSEKPMLIRFHYSHLENETKDELYDVFGSPGSTFAGHRPMPAWCCSAGGKKENMENDLGESGAPMAPRHHGTTETWTSL